MKLTFHDATTGKTTNREASADELAKIEADKLALEALMAEKAATESAKEAALAKLGLTAEELKALLS